MFTFRSAFNGVRRVLALVSLVAVLSTGVAQPVAGRFYMGSAFSMLTNQSVADEWPLIGVQLGYAPIGWLELRLYAESFVVAHRLGTDARVVVPIVTPLLRASLGAGGDFYQERISLTDWRNDAHVHGSVAIEYLFDPAAVSGIEPSAPTTISAFGVFLELQPFSSVGGAAAGRAVRARWGFNGYF